MRPTPNVKGPAMSKDLPAKIEDAVEKIDGKELAKKLTLMAVTAAATLGAVALVEKIKKTHED